MRKKLIWLCIILAFIVSVIIILIPKGKKINLVNEELAIKIAKAVICEHGVEEENVFLKATLKENDWHVSLDVEKLCNKYGKDRVHCVDYDYNVVIGRSDGKIKVVKLLGYEWKNGVLMYDNRALYD